MREEYITIKEFSKLASKTEQSIYQRINRKNSDLFQYVKVKDGKKTISKKALSEIYNIPEEAEEKENTIDDNKAILKTIEILEDQLKQKDKTISELQNQLSEAYKQISSLAQKTQYISALDKTEKIIDKQSEAKQESDKNMNRRETKQVKKGLFKRFKR